MQSERSIIHIDMNAYFASVEQRVNPLLRGKAVLVTGEGRSVVVTASYEARAYGVRTGMNIYEARRLCPHGIIVYADFNKYIDTAMRIHEILLGFTDQVEPFSIDECFLDVTGSIKLFGPPVEIGRKIKNELKVKLGLPASAGIGPNKLIAKLASEMQKPDGLVEIKKEDVPGILEQLPVEELCGIGDRLAEHLRCLGIRTAGELGRANIDMLVNYFGIIGYRLKQMGMGVDNSPVRCYDKVEQIKSIGHSYTLHFDTWDMEIILSYLRMLSEMVGSRLRRHRMVGKTLILTLRYDDFLTFSKHLSGNRMKNGWEIYERARRAFNSFLPLRRAVRLLGVSISGLEKDSAQCYLFSELEKRDKIAEAMDRINGRYGEFTIKPLSLMVAEQYGTSRHVIPLGKPRILNKRGT